MNYVDELNKRIAEKKEKEKQDLTDATIELVNDLNEIWESKGVWERAQLKTGTISVIQIVDSMNDKVKEDERIALTNDGIQIAIGDVRYKIENWTMRGVNKYSVSAELINAIYSSLAD